MNHRRLLLISPVFHGYWRSISDAFERRGYTVISHLYDQRSRADTFRYKAFHELPERLGVRGRTERRTTESAITAISRSRPDIIVIIRADRMLPEFWDVISRHHRTVLWLYDEVRRTAHSDRTLSSVTSIATYSRADATDFTQRGFDATYVANGFDQTVPVPRRGANGAVTFIGARYANRDALMHRLHGAGIPVRAFGRDWSNHPFDRLRTWRFGTSMLPNGRDVPRAEAYGIMRASTATLNMHFNQDGFTMRTFEAAGVGAVQLIDRPDVAEFYDPDSEIAVFRSPEEAIELARRAQRDPAWANGIRENGRRRTLAEHTFDHRVAELEKLWE